MSSKKLNKRENSLKIKKLEIKITFKKIFKNIKEEVRNISNSSKKVLFAKVSLCGNKKSGIAFNNAALFIWYTKYSFVVNNKVRKRITLLRVMLQ